MNHNVGRGFDGRSHRRVFKVMTLKTRKIDNLTFSFINENEFEGMYNETFKYNQYRFTADTSAPFILDCGSNIGVSVVYFKTLYPQAKIIAFEPSPDTSK